ncbi:uncharacterized protein DS421_13g421410 [Arachis hypogaea]|nr:uncharacterized protein DS421_13g421390 [Arachis hypogaea]QHO02155.1 uncharacterized protein DS421_13g421410 [Arachis hypogaea]
MSSDGSGLQRGQRRRGKAWWRRSWMCDCSPFLHASDSGDQGPSDGFVPRPFSLGPSLSSVRAATRARNDGEATAPVAQHRSTAMLAPPATAMGASDGAGKTRRTVAGAPRGTVRATAARIGQRPRSPFPLPFHFRSFSSPGSGNRECVWDRAAHQNGEKGRSAADGETG